MDDNSPLLTPAQRETLNDLAEGREADRRELSRLRGRVRSIIAEFPILLAGLPDEERRKIFADLDEYQAFLERKWDKPAVTLDGESESDTPGPLSGRMRRSADDPDAIEEDGGRLHQGIIATLGFLYAGVDDSPTFESMLEEAIRQSRRADGKVAVDVDVSIEMEREERRDELIDQWAAGDLDEEAVRSLLKSDPVALFEAGLADDEEE